MATRNPIDSLPPGFEMMAQPQDDEAQHQDPMASLPPGFEIEGQGAPATQEASQRNISQSLMRDLAVTPVRAFESIAGLPGDLMGMVKIGPELISEGFKNLGFDSDKVDQVKEAIYGVAPGGNLASSEDFKEAIKKGTLGKLEAGSAGEELYDDTIDFIAPFMIPGGAGAKALTGAQKIKSLPVLKKLAKKFVLGMGATAIGKVAEGITGSKGAGTTAQVGSFVALSMFNPKGVPKYVSALYDTAKGLLPQGVRTSTKPLRKSLGAIEREIKTSLSPSVSEKKVLSKIKEIKSKLGAAATVDVEKIQKGKKSFNADLSDWMKDATTPNRKQLKNYGTQVNGAYQTALAEYGKTNPEWFTAFKEAENAYAVKEQSELFSRLVKDMFRGGKTATGAKLLIPPAISLLPGGIGLVGKGVVPSYYMARFMYRYAKSPQLRKYYNDMLWSVWKESASATLKNAKKIDRDLDRASP